MKHLGMLLSLVLLGGGIVYSQRASAAKLLYQGHGSVRIISAAGKIIYVDPYAGKGYDLAADYILVTHEHPDHNAVRMVKKEKNCRILRAKQFLSGGKYGEFVFDGIRIQAVPAYNENHRQSECVGYVITLENGVSIYCAGDTSYTDYMQDGLAAMKLDYALLPCDGVFNMDAAEAARCADIIGARHAIPVHTKPGVLFDSSVAERFETERALIMRPGQEITLQKDEGKVPR